MLPTLVVPIIDCSGSMGYSVPIIAEIMRKATPGFEAMPKKFITFNNVATYHPHGLPRDLAASGGTDMAKAFAKLEEVMADLHAKRYVVIFISDGCDSSHLPGKFADRVSSLRGPPLGSECCFLSVMFGDWYPTNEMQRVIRPRYHTVSASGLPWMFKVNPDTYAIADLTRNCDEAFSMLFSVVENLDLHLVRPVIGRLSSSADVMRMASFTYNEFALELVSLTDLAESLAKLGDLRGRLKALRGIGGKSADFGIDVFIQIVDRTTLECVGLNQGVGSFPPSQRGRFLSEGNHMSGKHFLKGLRRFQSDYDRDLAEFVSKAITFVAPPTVELEDFIMCGSEREAMEELVSNVKENPELFASSAPNLVALADRTPFFVHCVNHPRDQYKQMFVEPYFYRIENVGSINTVTTTTNLSRANLQDDRREPINGCMLISTCPQWLASRLSEQLQTKFMTGQDTLHFHNAHLASAAAFVACLLKKHQCTDHMIFVLRMLARVYALDGVAPNKSFHAYAFTWTGPGYANATSTDLMPDIGKAVLAMAYALFNSASFGWHPSALDLALRRDVLLVHLFSTVGHPRTILQVSLSPQEWDALFQSLAAGVCEEAFDEKAAVAAFQTRLESADVESLIRTHWKAPADGFESIKGPQGYPAYNLWGWTPKGISAVFSTLARSRGLTLGDDMGWGCLERALGGDLERADDNPILLVLANSVSDFRSTLLKSGKAWIAARFAAFQAKVHATGVTMIIPPGWLERVREEKGITPADVGMFQGVPKWACSCLSCPFFMKRVGTAALGGDGHPILNPEMKHHLKAITDVLGLHKTTFLCKDLSPAGVAEAIMAGKHTDPKIQNIKGKPSFIPDMPAYVRAQIEVAMRDAGAVVPQNKTLNHEDMAAWLENEVRMIRAVGTYETFAARMDL